MWLDRYRGLLCDLDGCLILAGRPLPGARELISYAGERLVIISNNSTDTPEILASKLFRIGLPVPPDRIVLAGATAIERLAASAHRAHVAIYGSSVIVDYAKSLGLTIDHKRPDFVLLARDVRFSYARLHRIVQQIELGAALVVSNLDISHPGVAGGRVFETGVLLAAIRTCLPTIAFQAVGKPAATLYEVAMKRISSAINELIAIGDNPVTDGQGARQLGIHCVLVGKNSGAQFGSLSAMLGSQRAPQFALENVS